MNETASFSKPLGRRFLGLTAVNLAASLSVPLAGVVDTAMLGRLPSIGPLAGVALAALVFDYLYFGCGFLRMGTTGTTAQARGRGDRAEERFWLLRAAALALVLGAVILLASPLIERFSFAVLGGSAEIEDAGRAYYRARIWGAPECHRKNKRPRRTRSRQRYPGHRQRQQFDAECIRWYPGN
jgi:MATE family multidrug resistance protein